MKTFDNLVIKGNQVTLDGEVVRAVFGKHSLWLPDKEIKLTWMYNGRIEAFKDWELGRNRDTILNGTFNSGGFDLESIKSFSNEVEILSLAAKEKFCPPIGDIIYIRHVESFFPFGVQTSDPFGIYGYYMKDATKLPKGEFNVGRFIAFAERNKIKISDGALGDLKKEDNKINGYLVDIRRTIWDMMSIDSDSSVYIEREGKNDIKDQIFKLTQFPHKERKRNYQSYYIGDEKVEGSRDTETRFNVMKIPKDLSGYSVVDLGCCLGEVCFECFRRGARKITALDYEQDYIDAGRRLARYNRIPINFMKGNLLDVDHIAKYLNKIYPEGIGIVFALSLYKHIGKTLFQILDSIQWKICYVESNNATEGLFTPHVHEMVQEIIARKYVSEVIGYDSTRSMRVVWRLCK